MEENLSEVLDNLLGMLLLEGSYEIEEGDDSFSVSIETKDAGRLIGARGESLEALQLLINQMVSKKVGEVGFKRVVVDVEGWRRKKEEDLIRDAKSWGRQVLESGQNIELEPQSPWQRRVIHMTISELTGVESESFGEGRDRHIIIKLKTPAKGEARQRRQKSKVKSLSRAKSRDEEN